MNLTDNKTLNHLKGTDFVDVFAKEIYEQTYRYGLEDINSTFYRIAKDLASVEKDPDYWTNKFQYLLEDFKFVPGGRIISNAGTGLSGTTYINCFTPNTKVLTNNGYKNISDIEIGDMVLTHMGRFKPVVSLMRKPHKGKMVTFKSPFLTEEICSTLEHPFYNGDNTLTNAENVNELFFLKYQDNNKPNKTIDVYEYVKDVTRKNDNKKSFYADDDYVYAISEHINTNGGSITTRSRSKTNRYIDVNEQFAYVLGRFIGDGSTFSVNGIYEVDGFNIVFNNNEIETLKYVKEILDNLFGIETNINSSNQFNGAYIRKNNIVVSNFLKEMCGRYSYIKNIPNIILESSQSIRESFIMGLFDADGTITTKESKITLNNEKLINELQTLLLSCKIPSNKRVSYVKGTPYYGLSFVRKYASRLIEKTQKKYNDDRIDEYCEELKSINNTQFDTNIISNLNDYDIKIFSTKNFDKEEIDYDGYVYNISVLDDESYVVNNVIVHNCFVDGFIGEDQDSMSGIFDALRRQGLILKSEGGYGFCADVMRPRGAFIQGIGNESPGAVRMLDMWDTQSAVITEGSGKKSKKEKSKQKIRKGAQMVTMSCWHPDIEEFITAKQTSGRLTKFNMSVLITDDFMEAVDNNQPLNLEFPDYEANISNYKKYWNGNLKEWKSNGHPTTVFKTYENANELWDLIMESTYNRNEPGVLYVDTMNRLNNLYYCEFINATNPCLTGETKVYVADGRGYVTIKELANEGKDVPVFCYDNNKKIVIKMMRNPRITGYNQKIYKVTLDDGNVIRTTGNHKFKLKNGEYKEVANLSYGDSLDILLRDEDLKEHKYIADFHYNTDLNIGDIYHKDNNKLNNNINNLFIDSETLSNEALISHTKILIDNLNRLFTYDEWIQYCENNNILDFYYNWSKNNNSSILSLGKYSMIDMGLIQETNDEYKYYLSMGYDCFIENNVIKFNKVCENTKKSFVTIKPEHMVLEKSNISYSTYNEYYSTPFTDIVSIEEDGFENVYNGTVDEYHNFFVGGFETTNEFGKPCFVNLNNLQCGEQVLPIGAVCLLGSINLTQFIDYDNKTWNFEKLKEIIPIAVRLMDNVNDVTKVPLEIQQQNLKDKRRIGLGIMGYGSALMMLKIKYGSPEALKITEDLMQFIANTAYQASSDIALEKGSFTLFDMDKYLAGNFVKNLSSETIEKIRKQGLRNSHLLSIQPTGNSSILANIVSGGLEPIFMPEYKRTSIMPYPPNGLDIPHNIDWVNKTYTSNTKLELTKEGDENLLKTKHDEYIWKYDKSRGLLRETIVKDYAVRYLQNIGEWDSTADWAATTTELSIDEHILTMSVMAKYIDSAMSKTVNIPTDYPYNDFKRLYKELYNSGVIKGGTSYRAGTMTEVLGSVNDKIVEHLNKIQKTNAPKRPEVLDCEIHHISSKGEKWIVLVGMFEDDPYEVFAFKSSFIQLSDKIKSGKTRRAKKGHYNLECNELIIENIAQNFETDEQEALTRMISTALRHGANIEFVVDQLLKSEGTITSFSKAIGRTLKKYIKEQVLKKTCESCGSHNVSLQEGCYVCLDCGSSKCS